MNQAYAFLACLPVPGIIRTAIIIIYNDSGGSTGTVNKPKPEIVIIFYHIHQYLFIIARLL